MMSTAIVIPLTEARAQLFRLADEVLSGHTSRVRLSHRSHPDDLLLIRASTVAQLEREVADLRSRVAPELRALAGLGTLLVDDDALLAALAESRAEAAHASDRKQCEWARGLRYAETPGKLAGVAEQAAASGQTEPPRGQRPPRG